MLIVIPLVVVILSLGVILFIFVRHVQKTSSINLSELPDEREAQLKATLLENQLLRKINISWRKVSSLVAPILIVFTKWYESFTKRLKKIERAYRFQGGSPLPDSASKSDSRIESLIESAKESVEKGEFREAESGYLAAIKIDPGAQHAYEGLGEMYIEEESWDQARETFEYITRQWPQNDKAFASLALIEKKSGKLEEAKDHYLHALSINNEEVEYHLSLVDVYLGLNDKEKALSSLQKSQKLSPSNPKILDRLLQLAIMLGNKSIAIEALEKIKKVNPEHGKIEELEKKIKDLK